MTKFYTLREVAQILGIPQSTLYEQSHKGRLPKWMGAIRIGSSTRFPKAVIDAAAEGKVSA